VLTLVYFLHVHNPDCCSDLKIFDELVLGVRATSQLSMEFFSEDPLLVVRSVDTFMRHLVM
jgi:hypothetical protein